MFCTAIDFILVFFFVSFSPKPQHFLCPQMHRRNTHDDLSHEARVAERARHFSARVTFDDKPSLTSERSSLCHRRTTKSTH